MNNSETENLADIAGDMILFVLWGEETVSSVFISVWLLPPVNIMAYVTVTLRLPTQVLEK